MQTNIEWLLVAMPHRWECLLKQLQYGDKLAQLGEQV